MSLALGTLVGACAGLHAALWGSYKDGPYEGFAWRRFLRSILVGGVLGGIAQHLLAWDLAGDRRARLVAWGLCYCLERAACELWKSFIREEDQAKYFIPMQFGVLGRPIKDARVRIPIGIAIASLCVLLALGLGVLDRRYGDRVPDWLLAPTIGSLFGWISAFGGAWKDAPIEGFETLKFFRSPLVAAAWAALLVRFDLPWLVLSLAAEGFTVASIETYKTFGTRGRAPGKFAGKPVLHPEHLTRRRIVPPVFAALWLLVLGHLL